MAMTEGEAITITGTELYNMRKNLESVDKPSVRYEDVERAKQKKLFNTIEVARQKKEEQRLKTFIEEEELRRQVDEKEE